MNRKSLNVETNRRRDEEIRVNNKKFLEKLCNLKPSIDTNKLIQQHNDRKDLVKRICTFPLTIEHNSTASHFSQSRRH